MQYVAIRKGCQARRRAHINILLEKRFDDSLVRYVWVGPSAMIGSNGQKKVETCIV
eukprot:Awhi_evm1s4948